MSCCYNELGSFPHNRVIDTGLDAEGAGVYELRFVGPNFTGFSKFIGFGDTDDIEIPVGILNEDCVYTLEIVKPGGTLMSQDDCTTFRLSTFINKIACEDVEYL